MKALPPMEYEIQAYRSCAPMYDYVFSVWSVDENLSSALTPMVWSYHLCLREAYLTH